MFMDWLKKAPTSITIAVITLCGVLILAVLTVYTVLTLAGDDTSDFRQWVQTIGQLLVYPLLGTSAVASVAAARSSSNAEDNTNGMMTTATNKIESDRVQIETLKDQARE